MRYGVIFFMLEKLGAVTGVSNLHIYAAMRGQSLEEFQKTRNAQITYSVAGKEGAPALRRIERQRNKRIASDLEALGRALTTLLGYDGMARPSILARDFAKGGFNEFHSLSACIARRSDRAVRMPRWMRRLGPDRDCAKCRMLVARGL